jgi:hypothetical protein
MNAITRTSQLFDVGDPNAPSGSAAWCKAALERIRELKRQSQSAVSSLKYRLLSFAKDQHFTKLTDRDGSTFSTWEDFVQYPEPFGLGMRVEVVRAIMVEEDDRKLLRDVVDAVPAAGPAIHAGPGRGHKTDSNTTGFIGRGSAYLIGRLKRDAPEFAKRLAAGEFRSARAAALAAGIITETSQLTVLRRAWKRASPNDRSTFLSEVTQ